MDPQPVRRNSAELSDLRLRELRIMEDEHAVVVPRVEGLPETRKAKHKFGEVLRRTVHEVVNSRSEGARSVRAGVLDFAVRPRPRREALAALIAAETAEEVKLGLAGPAHTRDYFDRQYGRGNWRSIPRHIVHQADKDRPIDDGHTALMIACGRGRATVARMFAKLPTSLPSLS